MDDAGVMKLTPEIALVQTLDFFQPVVNDPRAFGRIVAANSLSDVWAMGAKALTAMNILAYPPLKIPQGAIEELLGGGCEKLKEAGVVLVGGHTMEQDQIFYGMSITGLINPERIITNARARVGDQLILSKPIGTGVYTEALSKDALTQVQYAEFVASMERLNLYASQVLQQFEISAMTDVTGFGLLGHALPLAKNAGVTLKINSKSVPFFSDVFELLERFRPTQSWKSKQYVGPYVWKADSVDSRRYSLLAEAQTSGGLLAAVPAQTAEEIVKSLRQMGDQYAAIIGEVLPLTATEEGKKIYLKVMDE